MSIIDRSAAARNGMPEAPGYVYRGTGRDQHTDGLDRRQIEAAIAAHEGPDYAPPLVPSGHTGCDGRGARRSRCGLPIWTGKHCTRRPGHPGLCTAEPPLPGVGRERTA